jgi:hypothetical protein
MSYEHIDITQYIKDRRTHVRGLLGRCRTALVGIEAMHAASPGPETRALLVRAMANHITISAVSAALGTIKT